MHSHEITLYCACSSLAIERHAHEMHAYEMHAYEIHAHEGHAHEGFYEDLARQNTVARLL
jgi:hypothetical protein